MTSTLSQASATQVISALRADAAELRAAGLLSLSLFGSVARGEARAESDVDLAVVFEPSASMDLFRLEAVQRRIGEMLGRRADLLPEPVEKHRLQARIDRDRLIIFERGG
jgi:predicted nucleotidyltransferase